MLCSITSSLLSPLSSLLSSFSLSSLVTALSRPLPPCFSAGLVRISQDGLNTGSDSRMWFLGCEWVWRREGRASTSWSVWNLLRARESEVLRLCGWLSGPRMTYQHRSRLDQIRIYWERRRGETEDHEDVSSGPKERLARPSAGDWDPSPAVWSFRVSKPHCLELNFLYEFIF